MQYHRRMASEIAINSVSNKNGNTLCILHNLMAGCQLFRACKTYLTSEEKRDARISTNSPCYFRRLEHGGGQ